MLDLSKPLGIHEGLIFYGDHELPDLVYYFPDEVGLAPQKDAPGLYEMYLQAFSESDVSEGGMEALRNSAGSILSLGVQCTVSEKRLQKAMDQVKDTGVFPENLKASPPPWRDGSVNLIVLDSDNSDARSINADSFVKSIVGSKKPSLMSSTLDSVFNVRLDRRGTAIVTAALEGDTGNVAGILYDLKFNALRPALDMRIWANLDRCYESVSHQLGVKVEGQIYVVKASLGADFGWLTKKLEEDGDLKIEVISQAEDAETKKMMDEMISDFKTSILREMFAPYINPEIPGAIAAGAASVSTSLISVGVSYRFTKENITQNKVIEVDYRERSAIVRTHNPQAHLWVVGKQIAAHLEKYIQHIRFGEVWREQSLSINLQYDFDEAAADLLSAEVMVWRFKDGIHAHPAEGHFSIPAGIDALYSVTFHKGNATPKNIAWNYEKEEPFGYYYQLRFVYQPGRQDVSSPSEIMLPPVYSSGNDLIIFPDTYIYYRKITVRPGNIDFADSNTVDVTFRLKDQEGRVTDMKIIVLSQQNQNQVWTVRGKDRNNLFIEVTKEYHYTDGRPSLTTEAVFLQDDEVIINKPFLRSAFSLIPVVAGVTEPAAEILLEITVTSPDITDPIKKLYRITGPQFNTEPLTIHRSTAQDLLSYSVKVILKDGQVIPLEEGIINSNALVIDLNKVNQRQVTVTWRGRSPAALGIKELKVEFRKDGDESTAPEAILYSGDAIPQPVVKTFGRNDRIEWRINKRLQNGSRIKSPFMPVDTGAIMIDAEKEL